MAEDDDFGAGGDFRSKAENEQGEDPEIDVKSKKYLQDLLAEKLKINREKLPITIKLIDQEMDKTKSEAGRGIPKYLNLFRERPTKVFCKALVPVKDHPKFNFVGKLLGPKGSTLKALQEDTMCRMVILGRGSIRNREKEQELRDSLELKYAHLADDLHVEITSTGPPAEAYARIAYALSELQKCLVPDVPDAGPDFEERQFGFKGRPGQSPSGPMGRSFGRGPPSKPSLMRSAPRMPPGAPYRGGPGKPNVMSILDRAHSGMNDGYAEEYDEPYEPESIYDDYPTTGPSGYGGNRYDQSEYEPDYYGNAETQRWKPFKPAGAGARSEQSRYRPTPYSRGGK